MWRRKGLWVGVILFLLIELVPSGLHRIEGLGSRPAHAAAVATLMAALWFTEAIPIAATALLPLVVYPALSVFGDGLGRNLELSAAPYVDGYIFLFLGGMVLGAAMELWNLHRRLALHIMRAIGTEPGRLLLGVLVATAGLSLWISNTATAVTMTPIALALVRQLETAAGKRLSGLGAALMLAVAYAANLGGIGTKIGTGTNSIYCGFLEEKLGYEMGFVRYLAIGLPFVVIFLPVLWAALWRLARTDELPPAQGRAILDQELAALGPMKPEEVIVATVFLVAAVLWVLGDPVRAMAQPWLPAWFKGKHYEASVAMAAALALVPFRTITLAGLRRVPWDTLLLLGGSFAMAAGIEGSGLARWLTLKVRFIADAPLVVQLAIASTATVALSAVASNTATVNVMLNILPRSLPVLTATSIAASCDFALPAGTPPNAIVFGSGYVRIQTMMRTGLGLDLLAAAAITVYSLTWVRVVL